MKYKFLFQIEFQLKLKQNLNLWNLIVTSKSFCLVVRCFFCIIFDLVQWLLLWTMTLRQTKWIVEMFQRNQHDYRLIDGCFHRNFEVHVSRSFFKTKETTVQGKRNFHILLMYNNYAINISVTWYHLLRKPCNSSETDLGLLQHPRWSALWKY